MHQVPQGASNYVVNIFKPLTTLQGEIPANFKQQWTTNIIQRVTVRYVCVYTSIITYQLIPYLVLKMYNVKELLSIDHDILLNNRTRTVHKYSHTETDRLTNSICLYRHSSTNMLTTPYVGTHSQYILLIIQVASYIHIQLHCTCLPWKSQCTHMSQSRGL